VSENASGDGSIVARLTAQQNTSPCAKAGIMYRAGTDAGAVNYSVVMLPGCHYSTSSIQVNYRDTSGGYSTTAADVPYNLPLYLRATRTGATFTAAVSPDGTTWTTLANSAVSLPAMPANAMVGLAVASQDSAMTGAASFDSVALTGATDLATLDTATEQVTQTIDSAGSPTDLQVHNGPAAVSNGSGWNPLNLGLTSPAGTGVYSPTLVPFGLQLSPTSGGPGAATLTAEDGVALGLGLSGAASATGQVAGNTITYAGVIPAAAATGIPVDDGVQGTGPNQFNYVGGWLHCAAPPSGSNCRYNYYDTTNSADATANDYVTFAFNGTGVTYDATLGTNRGIAGVSIDGGAETPVDLYSSTNYPGNVAVYTSPALASGPHTLKIRVTGSKDANSVGAYVTVDRASVLAPSASDLSLRATGSGLDARLVLHSAGEGGPFVFSLAPGAGISLSQDVSGTIRATEPVTAYGDDGQSSTVISETGVTIQQPIATDSSVDPAAPVATGPATATLTADGTGAPALALSVDPAWLAAAGRVFPVQVDVPLVTIESAMHSNALGTVASCAPNAPAPQTEVVVGVEGGCTYHGVAYFDLSSVPSGASIASATLRLYTPTGTGPTGVQVYTNTAGGATLADAAQPPTWNTAPAVVTATAPIAQSGSNGHWQSWDESVS